MHAQQLRSKCNFECTIAGIPVCRHDCALGLANADFSGSKNPARSLDHCLGRADLEVWLTGKIKPCIVKPDHAFGGHILFTWPGVADHSIEFSLATNAFGEPGTGFPPKVEEFGQFDVAKFEQQGTFRFLEEVAGPHPDPHGIATNRIESKALAGQIEVARKYEPIAVAGERKKRLGPESFKLKAGFQTGFAPGAF